MLTSRRSSQPGPVRRFLVAVSIASLGALVAAAPQGSQQAQKPKQEPPEQQKPATAQGAAEQQPDLPHRGQLRTGGRVPDR